MSTSKIVGLLKKEVVLGLRNVIFPWAIVAPLLITVVMSLLTGVFFARPPRLGIYAPGETQVIQLARETGAMRVLQYSSAEALKDAVSQGVIDVGVIVPDGFDEAVKSGEKTTLRAYVFGESFSRNRAVIATTFGNVVRQIAGRELPLSVETVTVGEGALPIRERLFPFIVLLAAFFGGLLIPSASMIQEKQRKTLDAVMVAPVTPAEVVAAKMVVGFLVSVVTCVLTLAINRAFGAYPWHLLLAVATAAAMASAIGALAGIFLSDMATLLALWKSGALVLFFPALVYLFPKIPQIIAKFFPTYYVLEPLVQITKANVDFGAFWTNVYIGLVLDVLLLMLVFSQVKRLGYRVK
ncbi:ABC transporter permease [Coprothermobacteraceae bacterium]|nr:ABC transporter permease [Coprothermobacteraceae bacterium]